MKTKDYIMLGVAGLVSLVKMANGQTVQGPSSNLNHNKNKTEIVKSSYKPSNVIQYSENSLKGGQDLPGTTDYIFDSTITQNVEFNHKNITGITLEQAKTIDEEVAAQVPYGVAHQKNFHETYLVWDAVNCYLIDDDGVERMVAHTYDEVSDPDTVEMINNIPNQRYKSFSLTDIPSIDALYDSLVVYYNGLGGTVGVEENEDNSNFSLSEFPNPYTNGFNIKSNEDISTIQIRNLSGQKVYESLGKVDANTTLFLQPELKDGMYILSATTKEGNTLVTKVIKE